MNPERGKKKAGRGQARGGEPHGERYQHIAEQEEEITAQTQKKVKKGVHPGKKLDESRKKKRGKGMGRKKAGGPKGKGFVTFREPKEVAKKVPKVVAKKKIANLVLSILDLGKKKGARGGGWNPKARKEPYCVNPPHDDRVGSRTRQRGQRVRQGKQRKCLSRKMQEGEKT